MAIMVSCAFRPVRKTFYNFDGTAALFVTFNKKAPLFHFRSSQQ